MRSAILTRIMLFALLSGIVTLSGCTQSVPTVADPLAGYDSAASLPHITAEPVAQSATATPASTPAPTEYTDWAELPLGDDIQNDSGRPTRKPTTQSAFAAEPDELIIERQNSETDNTGALQCNITGAGMACIYRSGETDYLYFTADDGELYRELLASGAAISWDTADAQAINSDRAMNFITSLQGDLLYINDHSELIRLTGGDGAAREVLVRMENMKCLTRWDDALYFIGQSDAGSGVYMLTGTGEAQLIVPDAQYMQLDVVNRRIITLDSTGIAACTLSGEPISRMIDGEITVFCYSGSDMYYSSSGSIYRLSVLGEVTRVIDSGAAWLACYNNMLLYTDAANMLHRATLDGQTIEELTTFAVYNPTVFSRGIAYSLQPDAGISASVAY